MVNRLHAAGLEVVLDVVFNHTAEGGAGGPTLCHRGLDNRAYYRLDAADPARYVDTTGTGNAVNADHPVALRMIMDSLRYWVSQMGADGFRFDVATTLGRKEGDFDPLAAFFALVAQDPVVSRVKLIAEPWDAGRFDSYTLGRFPPLWSEWNGRFRDAVREFWRSRDGRLSDFASRLCASADLYGSRDEGRRPTASVNFVTVHDGFTLADLVSYNDKHNDANLEGNRDGTSDNRSWNCWVEGPTAEPDVLKLRARQQRAFIATLVMSAGVPLLLGGDEFGPPSAATTMPTVRTTRSAGLTGRRSIASCFASQVTSSRCAAATLSSRRRRSLTGPAAGDLRWFTPSGSEMTDQNWADPLARSVAMLIDGSIDPDCGEDGSPLLDDDLLVLINGWWEPMTFTLPDEISARCWQVICATFDGTHNRVPDRRLRVGPRSVVICTCPAEGSPSRTGMS